MLLAVDIGNTHTVLGLFDGGRILHTWRLQTDTRATADELMLAFRGLLEGFSVTGVALLSTVPAALREMRTMLSRYYTGVPTVIVEPGVRTGVPLLVDNPREVGADRLVNSLAAFHLYGGPAVVVDFGTGTNLDVVSARGEFLGGAVAPGVEISVEALAVRAAQLRKIELVAPRHAIGKNTVEVLQSGVVYGFAGLVDGLVRRILRELGGRATVVGTGGLAGLVVEHCDTVTLCEPDLTLIGLRLVFEKNT